MNLVTLKHFIMASNDYIIYDNIYINVDNIQVVFTNICNSVWLRQPRTTLNYVIRLYKQRVQCRQ